MRQLSLQELVDYLHTAATESDLLYVHYWLRELEDRGRAGRDAIRLGKHSWKDETAMETVLHHGTKLDKANNLILELLTIYGARSRGEHVSNREQGSLHTSSEQQYWKAKWQLLKVGNEAREQAERLASMSSEKVAHWIDAHGLAPSPAKRLTGCGPLPSPPTREDKVDPLPPVCQRSNIPKEFVAEVKVQEKKDVVLSIKGLAKEKETKSVIEVKRKAESIDPQRPLKVARSEVQEKTFTSSTASPPPITNSPSPPLASPPSPPPAITPPKSRRSSRLPTIIPRPAVPAPAPRVIIADPSNFVRVHSFAYSTGQSLLPTIKREVTFMEKPKLFELYNEQDATEKDQGFILVQFESRIVASLAVCQLITKFQAKYVIELESEYQERQSNQKLSLAARIAPSSSAPVSIVPLRILPAQFSAPLRFASSSQQNGAVSVKAQLPPPPSYLPAKPSAAGLPQKRRR